MPPAAEEEPRAAAAQEAADVEQEEAETTEICDPLAMLSGMGQEEVYKVTQVEVHKVTQLEVVKGVDKTDAQAGDMEEVENSEVGEHLVKPGSMAQEEPYKVAHFEEIKGQEQKDKEESEEAAPPKVFLKLGSESPAAKLRAAVSAAGLVREGAWDKTNQKLCEIPGVQALATLLTVSPVFVVACGIVGLLGFLLFGFGGHVVCLIAGALYPGFESFKAVEAADTVAMQFWLTYWVVFVFMSAIEHVLYYILVWIPFYYPTKLVLLLVCSSREIGGAKVVYRVCVAPVLRSQRERIDSALDELKSHVKRGAKRAVTAAFRACGYSTWLAGVGLFRPSFATMSNLAVRVRRSMPGRMSPPASESPGVDQDTDNATPGSATHVRHSMPGGMSPPASDSLGVDQDSDNVTPGNDTHVRSSMPGLTSLPTSESLGADQDADNATPGTAEASPSLVSDGGAVKEHGDTFVGGKTEELSSSPELLPAPEPLATLEPLVHAKLD